MDVVNEAVARATKERDLAVRLQVGMEIAHGHSAAQAVRTTAYKSGLTQDKVREIIGQKPPAVRRRPQEAGA